MVYKSPLLAACPSPLKSELFALEAQHFDTVCDIKRYVATQTGFSVDHLVVDLWDRELEGNLEPCSITTALRTKQ